MSERNPSAGSFKTIPLKPEVFENLKQIKNKVQVEIGVKVGWNSFIRCLVFGELQGTLIDKVIKKAMEEYHEQEQWKKPSMDKTKEVAK